MPECTDCGKSTLGRVCRECRQPLCQRCGGYGLCTGCDLNEQLDEEAEDEFDDDDEFEFEFDEDDD